MDNPKISIIVPVYNVESKLGKCIESLLHQSFSDIEIILVNDGSTDNSLGICQSYQTKDSRIKVFDQSNQGLSAARNTGLTKATGQYVMFVDSDDFVTNDFCKDAISNVMRFNADLGFFNFCRIENGQSRNLIQFGPKDCSIPKEEAFESLLTDSYAWNKIYRRELFDNIGYPVGINYEDLYTTYKLVNRANKLSYCSSVNYNYVSSGVSIVSDMSSKNIQDQFGGVIAVMDFLHSRYPKAYRKNISKLIEYAIRYCTYCNKKDNKQYYLRAYAILKNNQIPSQLDASHRIIMRLFKISAPLTRFLLLIRRRTNQ